MFERDSEESLPARVYHTSVFALLLLVLLPGYQRAAVAGRIVNITAFASVAILLLLSGHFLVRSKKSIHILVMLMLFAAETVLGYVIGGDFTSVAKHAFTFAPFIIAYLLLELDVGTEFRTAYFWITVCGAIGAVMANAIHLFRPDLLMRLLKEEENIDAVIVLGRVGWTGYVMALASLVQLCFLDMYTRTQRAIIVMCVPVTLAGALLTFTRTTLISVVIVLAYVTFLNRGKIGLKHIALIGVAAFVTATFVRWWGQVNPNLMNLIQGRIFSFFAGSSDVSGDVSTRLALYREYEDHLKSSFLLGQGLGVPLSTYLGVAFWSDVTLVSFAVPFGIFGLAMFATFLMRVYNRIQTRISDPQVRRLFVLLLFVGLLSSLNDDIWSHKFFPVYLVFLINSFPHRGSRMRDMVAPTRMGGTELPNLSNA